ncbi:MAG: O-antigen ligase family protein [Elusimicrobia bacterium]|nr:O-antigen ligase family protein [Elusimicrobiota bacterium]
MTLSYTLAFVLGLAPALQAVFDLPLQLALQRGVLAAFLAWIFLSAYRSGIPRALAGRRFVPLWAAAGLSLLSLISSPFRGYVLNEWGNYAAGLLIFLAGSLMAAGERDRVERALRWGGWLVFGVALLQAFALRNFLSAPPLTNLNALALYAVMVLPLAAGRRDWLLTVAMAILVIWTQSIGAILAAVVAAGFYAVSRRDSAGFRENQWILVLLGAVAAAVLFLLQADSVAGRLAWWRSAWEMFLARPFTGFGHASFTWAQAAFQQAGAFREHSVYAHNYYLEFLAENGLPAAAAWFFLLFRETRVREGAARYALIAALTHSFVDFGLSVPANFWVFCWLLSSPAEEAGLAVPPRSVLNAALAFSLLLAAALARLDLRSLAFEKERVKAISAAAAGDLAGAGKALAPELRGGVFRAPALELLGSLHAAYGGAPDGFGAAVYFEMALLENRYSAASWAALRRIYSAEGLEGEAAGLEARRGEVFR